MDFERIATLADMYRKGTYNESISIHLIKLQEELGEAAQAYIGAIGHNPRKGFTHTFDDVAKEIVDIIVTGFVALATVQSDVPWQDVQSYFNDKAIALIDRALKPENGGPRVPVGDAVSLSVVHPTKRAPLAAELAADDRKTAE